MMAHFIIAGAQRSGSTYLYHLLANHPEIEMVQPVRPEPKFFMNDDDVSRGLAYYERKYFGTKPGAWLAGEKSVSYMESEASARNIRKLLPDVKLVFLMRHPIERAISNYRFSAENGIETLSLVEALSEESSRLSEGTCTATSVSPFAYASRGRYVEYLDMYAQYFDRKQILLYLFETLVGNLKEVQKLYGDLGVSTRFVPDSLDRKINMSHATDMEGLSLPHDVRIRLIEYYSELNRELSARYGLDLRRWQEVDEAYLAGH